MSIKQVFIIPGTYLRVIIKEWGWIATWKYQENGYFGWMLWLYALIHTDRSYSLKYPQTGYLPLALAGLGDTPSGPHSYALDRIGNLREML
tara:strand:- start:74 stop:346 length:273 start_codon:yes stop_codon:yes gene_type:complete